MIPNIFVSSTVEDLRYLRDGLRDAIVELAYNLFSVNTAESVT